MFNPLKTWFQPTHHFSERDSRPPSDQSMLASLLTMAWYVEARDPYTGGHLWRVSRYAHLLAEASGFTEAEATRISLGGFLHDLGKIGIPDAILRKPERLTDTEYEVIKTHPSQGLRLLAGHPLAALVRDAVRYHHERMDGAGYPYGLSGTIIPAEARVVAICDAFDAMTSHRPYRRGMARDQALAIIADELGRQFDRALGERFLELGYVGQLDHIQGHSDDGIPLRDCPLCGPTLVLWREQRPDDKVYCRHCGGEFLLKEGPDALDVVPTGARGSPEALTAEADGALIKRIVARAVAALPRAGMTPRMPSHAWMLL